MTELEKVLNGIEEVRKSGIQCPLENVEPRRCSHFPEKLIDDIVSLLKAQEARVMTLEEVLAHDYNDGPLWLETYDNGITCGFAYCYKYYVQFSIPVMENEYLLKRDTWIRTDTYNKIWRCWTSRPTDEQMEAVKWE